MVTLPEPMDVGGEYGLFVDFNTGSERTVVQCEL